VAPVCDGLVYVVKKVGPGNATCAGERVIHVAETHTAAHDELAAREPLDDARRELNAVIHHQRVAVLDAPDEFVLAVRIQCGYFGEITECALLVIERFGDEIGDDNFAAGHWQFTCKWFPTQVRK